MKVHRATLLTSINSHAVSAGVQGHAASAGVQGHVVSAGKQGHAVCTGVQGHVVSVREQGHAVCTGVQGPALSADVRVHCVPEGILCVFHLQPQQRLCSQPLCWLLWVPQSLTFLGWCLIYCYLLFTRTTMPGLGAAVT